MKKRKVVVRAAMPVRAPSRMPVAESIYAVTGLVPMAEPTMMPMPSLEKAQVEFGKRLLRSTKPGMNPEDARGWSLRVKGHHGAACKTSSLGCDPWLYVWLLQLSKRSSA